MKRVFNIYCIVFAFALVGCAQVKPWEKGNLARDEMAWVSNPLNEKISHHIYHSKEGSSGGAGAAGGGCGCN